VQHSKLLSFLVLFTITATLSITPSLIPAQATPSPVPDRYIVILNDDANPWSVANEMAQERGLAISHVYGTAVNGFSAIVPRGQLDNIASDPRVNYIEQDYVMSISKKPADKPGNGGNDGGDTTTQPPQTIPTGIARINGGATGTVSVGVAVIDTGIASHPDLKIVDGINFSKGKASNYSDGHGHGTHVAGTIGAIDNDIGVIGVAPGADLYAVKVLDNRGSGFASDVIAGINWVAANSDKIKVANMSLGGSGSDSTCGGNDSYHNAICGAVSAGVTIVVAAGNDLDNAANYRPAAYDEVITVSALADFDGAAGGLDTNTSVSFRDCTENVDDSFACFSNYGADVDIIAPGVLIESTWKGGDYNTISGTSMASPHVAGAAALYIASNSGATPEQVKSALIGAGNYNWSNLDDGDNTKEPLLDVSLF
jgi:subtilisin family serine protease